MNHAVEASSSTSVVHMQHPPEMQMARNLMNNANNIKHQRNCKSNLITISINVIIPNLINVGRPTTASRLQDFKNFSGN
jgi:hypothetical protein